MAARVHSPGAADRNPDWVRSARRAAGARMFEHHNTEARRRVAGNILQGNRLVGFRGDVMPPVESLPRPVVSVRLAGSSHEDPDR